MEKRTYISILALACLSACVESATETQSRNNLVKIQQPELFHLGSEFVCLSKPYARQHLPELFFDGSRLTIDPQLVIIAGDEDKVNE